MGLKEYKAKRKFNKTPEPEGVVKKKKKGKLRFVIQKHHASHLHYDFRLELDGVLKSWAVPKGPSLNPQDKRLAMMVEDHPVEYGSFEGIIPPGNYGAGTVMLWDEGTYYSLEDEEDLSNEKALQKGLKAGNLKFILDGEKLKGEFALVRMNRGKGNEWLLIKKKDEFATNEDITQLDRSVVSGRSLEEIKNESDAVWHSNSKQLSMPSGTPKGKFPHEVKPMMATLVNHAFDSNDWLFEIKWDGYRAIAEINFNDVVLYSRNTLSFNELFPVVKKSLEMLGVQAVVDGEVCVLNENGEPEFQLIQNYKRTGKGAIVYYVFDILHYEGYDLSSLPLVERKQILKELIPVNDPVIRYSDHIIGDGNAFLKIAREKNIEGIIAKRAQSLYQPGVRGKDWLKIKIHHEQEAVVVGYTEPRGGRKKFGALVLGVYEGDDLVYIGHSGGGFTEKTLEETFLRLNPLKASECPFRKKPKTNMPVTWVKPKTVCVVKFQEWTDEGLMRMPIFIGFRDDKDPKEVKREIEKPVNKLIKDEKTTKIKAKTKNATSKSETKKKKTGSAGDGRGQHGKVKDRGAVARRKTTEQIQSKKKALPATLLKSTQYKDDGQNDAELKISGHFLKLTNLKKVFWPEEGYTKEDLLNYYNQLSSYILPYLKNRPESLNRHPNGYQQQGFFQKDMPATTPDWIKTVEVFSESNEKNINYLICQDKATLLYMVNLGCIEINPWLSRVGSLEYPDYAVIDLDPQDVPFEKVIEAAHAVKEVLDRAAIPGYCKTSGSRGLHIYIPLGSKYTYDQAKNFAHLIAQLTHDLIPDFTSLERTPSKRRNKIYLDYLQNRKGQTLAAPYCVRPRKGATVSTPLEWNEVKPGLHPSQFTIETISERLTEKGDIFKGVTGKGIDLEKVLEILQR